MKKSIPTWLAAIVLMSVTWGTSHAEVAMNSPRVSSAVETGIFLKFKTGTPEALNPKAERNFKKAYQQASAAEWYSLGDHSLMCRFLMNGTLNRAFYSAHGQWIATVSSYDAGKLDKGVYDKVKSVYYNSKVIYVNQIDRVNHKTVYIVEIRDEKSIKKLRVDDDGVEIVEELVKE